MNDGILLIRKPGGITSHDVVYKVRKAYGTKQVGHAGTLDPMATGLLVVLVGNATKASDFAMEHTKTYEATLRLGLTTDTEDTGGTVLTTCDRIPGEEAVQSAVLSFLGTTLQVPPMYSALKVDGKKLVDLARKGVEVERQAREITVSEIKAVRLTDRDYSLSVSCSKGTYIRTLCADIGKKLGCGGAMASLIRTRVGSFSLENAVTPEELAEKTPEERAALLLPTEGVFSSLPIVRLPAFFATLARNGAEIYERKIGISYPAGTLIRAYDENGFFAVGEIRSYDEGLALKLTKRFER